MTQLVEQQDRRRLLVDTQQAHVFTMGFGSINMDQRRQAMLENLLMRRVQSDGVRAPNREGELVLCGRMDDFNPDAAQENAVRRQQERLCAQFEQDILLGPKHPAHVGTSSVRKINSICWVMTRLG
jgi:hypothetical protein